MGFAFEVTPDDAYIVLARHGLAQGIDDPVVKSAFALLDGEEIEAAALRGDSMEEQTDCALEAIEASLREQGVLQSTATFFAS